MFKCFLFSFVFLFFCWPIFLCKARLVNIRTFGILLFHIKGMFLQHLNSTVDQLFHFNKFYIFNLLYNKMLWKNRNMNENLLENLWKKLKNNRPQFQRFRLLIFIGILQIFDKLWSRDDPWISVYFGQNVRSKFVNIKLEFQPKYGKWPNFKLVS